MRDGWTEDRVTSLKKLWLEGQSATEIARQLSGGLTRNAVIGKVHRLGLSERTAPSQPARATFRPARRRAHRAPTTPQPAKHDAPLAVPETLAEGAAPEPDLLGAAVLMTLGTHMCKWPIGDPASATFSFCGRRAQEGVYCVEHARVAYQPIDKRKKDASAFARSLRRYL